MPFFVGYYVWFPISAVLLIIAIDKFDKGNIGAGMFRLAAIFGGSCY